MSKPCSSVLSTKQKVSFHCSYKPTASLWTQHRSCRQTWISTEDCRNSFLVYYWASPQNITIASLLAYICVCVCVLILFISINLPEKLTCSTRWRVSVEWWLPPLVTFYFEFCFFSSSVYIQYNVSKVECCKVSSSIRSCLYNSTLKTLNCKCNDHVCTSLPFVMGEFRFYHGWWHNNVPCLFVFYFTFLYYGIRWLQSVSKKWYVIKVYEKMFITQNKVVWIQLPALEYDLRCKGEKGGNFSLRQLGHGGGGFNCIITCKVI